MFRSAGPDSTHLSVNFDPLLGDSVSNDGFCIGACQKGYAGAAHSIARVTVIGPEALLTSSRTPSTKMDGRSIG